MKVISNGNYSITKNNKLSNKAAGLNNIKSDNKIEILEPKKTKSEKKTKLTSTDKKLLTHSKKKSSTNNEAIYIEKVSLDEKPAYPKRYVLTIAVLIVIAVTGWMSTAYFVYKYNNKPTLQEASALAGVTESINNATASSTDDIIEVEKVQEDISSPVEEATNIETTEITNAKVYDDDYYSTFIPVNYQNLFESSDYEYIEEDSTSLSINTETKTITIGKKDPSAIVRAVGLYIYYEYLEDDKDFKKLYEENVEAINNLDKGNIPTINSEENFAIWSFYMYCMKPTTLSLNAQNVYFYFDNMEFIETE